MFISSLVIFSFTILLFGSSLAATSDCTADYQCNTPFGFCSSSSPSSPSSSCKLIPGLGVSDEKIFFLGRCGGQLDPSTGASSHPGSVFIFSANLDGSGIEKLARLPEDTGATSPSYSVVARFIAISPYDFIIERSIRDANSFSAIDRQSFNETVIAGQRNAPAPSFFFDVEAGKTYSCLYFDLVVFDHILTTPVSSTPYTVLYNSTEFPPSNYCVDSIVVGDDVYVLSGANSGWAVLKGSVDGSVPLTLLFSIPSQRGIPAIAADSSAVYYTDDFSVDRYFTQASEHGPTLLFPDHAPLPNFTSIQPDGDELYFDDGTFIRRVNLTSLSTDDLIPSSFSFASDKSSSSSSPSSGQCACRPGFTGAGCAHCDGQVQWSNGIPSCIDILENGFPSACQQDYQCGNAPYTSCSAAGKCSCRPGFTGSDCAHCDGQVQWSNGIPSCPSSSESSSSSSESSASSSETSSSSSSSSSSSCEGVTITQSIRLQFPSGNETSYLYDISIHNGLSSSITTPTFFVRSSDGVAGVGITQSWNLVTYATTVPSQVLLSLFPNTNIAPGASYTSAGYIVRGTETSIDLVDCSTA